MSEIVIKYKTFSGEERSFGVIGNIKNKVQYAMMKKRIGGQIKTIDKSINTLREKVAIMDKEIEKENATLKTKTEKKNNLKAMIDKYKVQKSSLKDDLSKVK